MKKLLSAILAACLLLAAVYLPASAVGGFKDVPSGVWYEKAVNYCADNDYMNGTGGNSFTPGGKVTRAQMAQILYNFSKAPDVSALDNPFSDVGNVWYKQAVVFAKAAGVVNGTSATTYSPGKDITREEVTVMLMGYYTKSTKNRTQADPSVLDSFSDKSRVSSWAKNAIAWAVENKIMSGSDGKLDPRGTCTRAQLAQFIMNYCTACGKPAVIEIGGTEVPTPSPSPSPSPSPDVTPKPTPDTSKKSGNYYNQVAYPDDADNANWLVDVKDYVITDLSGPWDNCQPITTVPNGGCMKNGHRYNKYDVCIDTVDGLPNEEEKKAIILINQHRINNGLQPIIWDQAAQVIAETRVAEDCSGKTELHGGGHIRPDGSSPASVVNEWNKDGIMSNKLCQTFNENIHYTSSEPFENPYGYHAGDARETVSGWIKSPGHNGALKSTTAVYGAVAYGQTQNKTDTYQYRWFYNAIN